MEILGSDIERLNPGVFLNDTIIDFYIKYIQRDEAFSSKEKERFHFFNSFFYKKVSEVLVSEQGNFLSLRKWTRGTKMFTKEYIFVPIHKRYVLFYCAMCYFFVNSCAISH